MIAKWKKHQLNRLIVVWMALSVLMLICVSYFRINELIVHPQHGLFDIFDDVSSRIRNEREFWYRAFFVLDILWPLSLLTSIGLIVRDEDNVSLINVLESRTWFAYIYAGVAGAAYLTDMAENACYWGYLGGPLPKLVFLKNILYGAALLFLIYWLIKHYLVPYLKAFLKFVWTSLLSILFILLIYALVAFMPQGGTLVVQLFYEPWNIIFLFFLLAFLAIMVSHYPVYSAIWFYGDQDPVRLEKARKGRLLGFGLIYYNLLGTSGTHASFDHPVIKALRRSLGILLYIALFNIMFGLITRFYEVPLDSFTLSVFLLAITLWIYYLEGERYTRWKRILSEKGVPGHDQQKCVRAVVRYVRWFPRFFFISSALVIATAVVAVWLGWHRISVLLFLFTLGSQMFLYIHFKISRSFLKYVYRSERLFRSNKYMYNMYTLRLFCRFDPKGEERGRGWVFRLFGSLSNNIQYLNLMRLSGMTSLLLLILANRWFEVASIFNPIVIIVMYIILYYSLFVILFKHALYYQSLKKKKYWYQNFFKFGIPLVAVVVLAIAVQLAKQPNDLHRLREVSLHQQALGYLEYTDSLVARFPPRLNNYFFVGSYGGGLKANLWNLLIFHELDRASKGSFFQKTAVLSGVSGGAVGIGNYASLVLNTTPPEGVPDRILEIGNSNVLSNELTYLLGRDWIQEFIPLNLEFGVDRSYKSMQHHAALTGMEDFNEVALEDYWRDIYISRDNSFPALILNTTAVGGVQGVSSSVTFPPDAFAGAIDIPKAITRKDSTDGSPHGRSLTYFGAVSTTNRFPFFSPTAKVKGVASFLDGGYFDNSGLLSAMGAYDAMVRNARYDSLINPVFISIINSEDIYLAEKLRDTNLTSRSNTETSEVGSIINTIVSIDKLPNYTLQKIVTSGYAVELLMMPHKLSYDQVAEALNGDIPDPVGLADYIEAHNAKIDSVLRAYKAYDYEKWGVVEPPLARLLSEPAVQYQRAMIACHPDVRAAIDRIIEEYITEDERIDVEYQRQLIEETQAPRPGRIFKESSIQLRQTPAQLKKQAD